MKIIAKAGGLARMALPAQSNVGGAGTMSGPAICWRGGAFTAEHTAIGERAHDKSDLNGFVSGVFRWHADGFSSVAAQ